LLILFLAITFLACKFKYTSCNYFARCVHPYEDCRIGYICKQRAARLHWLRAAVSHKGVCLQLLLLHTAAYTSLTAVHNITWSGMSGMTNYHCGRTAKTTEETTDKMA